MHISAKGNYGLRAALDLAERYGQGHAQTAEIAERQQIPESYLVQLLNQLRKAGLIRSVRGPRGGHALLRQPEEITVGDVVFYKEYSGTEIDVDGSKYVCVGHAFPGGHEGNYSFFPYASDCPPRWFPMGSHDCCFYVYD